MPTMMGATSNNAPRACAEGRIEPRAVLVAPRQYVNMLHDVIGTDAVTEQDATASSELLFDTVDRPWLTTATLDRYVHLAEHATDTLRGKTAAFLQCTNLTDETCMRSALSRVARRIYKRPIAADELDQLMALRAMGVAAVATDMGETGALTALQALLVAPSTLYRTEFQAPLTDKRRVLTPHERSAALAAMLLDSVPDDALLAAADDGSLATPAGLQAQVDRLLQLPRVRQHLTQLVLTAYNVPRIFSTPKDPSLFPGYTPALQNSMYEETRRFVEDVLWTRSAPIGELLTSRHSFVDSALAKHYGLPAPARAGQFQAVELPAERAGLLTQASVMSVLSRTDKNSVVARGLFVRGSVLCLPKIPGPPMSVQALVAMQLDAKSSQKELAAYRAMTSPCMGCHMQFDRFGLLLESFDAIGRYLPQQSEAVDFTGLAPLDGVVMNVEALAARIEHDHLFEQCFADRTLSYALSVAAEPEELCLVAQPTAAAPTAAGSIRDLISAVVQSPAWTERIQAEP
jgi:hypothetical protein